jgi:hypothetical protein
MTQGCEAVMRKPHHTPPPTIRLSGLFLGLIITVLKHQTPGSDRYDHSYQKNAPVLICSHGYQKIPWFRYITSVIKNMPGSDI